MGKSSALMSVWKPPLKIRISKIDFWITIYKVTEGKHSKKPLERSSVRTESKPTVALGELR